MKKLISLSLLAALYAIPSHGLVIMVADCQTSDQAYRVSLLDNEGIGPDRSPNYSASISDKDGNSVGNYSVSKQTGMSISFGRTEYSDLETQGQEFNLAFPSTNYRHISLKAKLSNGEVLSDENMTCR